MKSIWNTFACVLICITLTATCFGARKNVYQPMGAPVDPDVAVQWNRYYDYADATELMRQMVKAHPKTAAMQSLGQSYEGREMWVLTVTNARTGRDTDKPAFWIDGAIHANEIQGTQVALYTAWYLLEMYGRNDFITQLVDQRTFYFVPMMSPDSRDAHMYEPNTTHSPRSGQVPVDDDRDGLIDEDPPDDLDGDGQITQMRVKDPNGRWKPDEKYPDFMVRADADERGSYRLLGNEGIDNDGDGEVNEDGDGYYDPNRDWAWGWQPGHIQRGAYRYPFSVPENRMVADFIMTHPNIAGAQSYHNTGGMILRGPGAKEDKVAAADLAVYDAIAKKGEMMLPGYRYLHLAEDLYPVYGGELDWLYVMRGIFTFSNELFTSYNFFRKETLPENTSRKEELAQFNRYLLFQQGVVPWKEIDHPQYGRIEVGGLKKQWRRQPPSFLLEEECHRNMSFTLYHADQMPQVTVQSVQVDAKDNGLKQVTACIANRKLTPTHCAADLEHHITPPDIVRLRGKGIKKVILALHSDSPFFEKSTEEKQEPAAVRIPNIRGMSAVYVRWLVDGKGPLFVTVESTKGGTARERGQF